MYSPDYSVYNEINRDNGAARRICEIIIMAPVRNIFRTDSSLGILLETDCANRVRKVYVIIRQTTAAAAGKTVVKTRIYAQR